MSYTSHSYSSYTSSSSTGNNPPQTTSYSQTTSSDGTGTTVHRISQRPGEATVRETFHVPTGGRIDEQQHHQARIEDVTDADKEYEESIEDEYAKREGGA